MTPLFFFQNHNSHLNQYIWTCLRSFYIIYKMVHCVETGRNMRTTFYLYGIYGIIPGAYMGDLFSYTYHVLSHWHQPHDKGNTAHILHGRVLMWFACITEQIWLPNCKLKLHWPHSVQVHRCDISANACQITTNCNTYFITMYVLETNMPLKLHHIFEGQMWGMCVYICATCERTGMNHVTRNSVHT